MRKFELTLVAVIVSTILLRFLSIPYIGILMQISLTLLALFYLACGILILNQIKIKDSLRKDSYKDISLLRKIGSFYTGASFSIICIGTLFKLQDLPGKDSMLTNGLIFMLIISIISIIKYLKKRSDFYKRLLIRIAIIGGLGIVILLIPFYST